MGYDPEHDDDRLPPVFASDLVRLLQKKAPRLATGLAAYQAAWPVVRQVHGRVKAARMFTVKVPGTPGDSLYEELHARVLAQIPEKKRRALVAVGLDRARPVVDELGNFIPSSKSHTVKVRYDGSREQQVTFGGCKVKVAVASGMPGSSGKQQTWQLPEIVFTATSPEARDAILAEIEDAYQMTRSKSRKPSFWAYGQWDEWERVEEIADRKLDSVILPEGQLDRIISDIRVFLDSETEYVRRCMPWHRGHAYWGPPGVGKTSVARAVASHFGLDVWYLPLADIKRDASLLKSVHRIKGKSVLLLEDVDVFHATTSREEDGGVTLSGVLNMLDGIGTPHGLITIMTSNTPEVLEDAVIRTGRADLVEEFAKAGPDEARKFLEWWFGEESPGLPESLDLPYSDIAETCKRSEDIQDAVKRLS
jgi:hypothetical protein